MCLDKTQFEAVVACFHVLLAQIHVLTPPGTYFLRPFAVSFLLFAIAIFEGYRWTLLVCAYQISGSFKKEEGSQFVAG